MKVWFVFGVSCDNNGVYFVLYTTGSCSIYLVYIYTGIVTLLTIIKTQCVRCNHDGHYLRDERLRFLCAVRRPALNARTNQRLRPPRASRTDLTTGSRAVGEGLGGIHYDTGFGRTESGQNSRPSRTRLVGRQADNVLGNRNRVVAGGRWQRSRKGR